jgi:hypothetical protein
MAEFAASIVGIVAAGTKVALVLSQLASDMGAAGHEARTIASEIRCLCSVLKTLHGTLEKVEKSPYYAHCVDVTKDMTDASLEMYADIIAITKGLQGMATAPEGRFGLRSRLYWATFRKGKILTLRTALEAYKSNLSLMLGTMDVSERVTRQMYVGIFGYIYRYAD